MRGLNPEHQVQVQGLFPHFSLEVGLPRVLKLTSVFELISRVKEISTFEYSDYILVDKSELRYFLE